MTEAEMDYAVFKATDGTMDFDDQSRVHRETLLTYDPRILQRRVARLCKEKNLSMSRVEKQLGFANGVLKKLDKVIPSVTRVFELAQFFKVSADYLIGLTNTRQENKHRQLHKHWMMLDHDQQQYVLGFMHSMTKTEQDGFVTIIRPKPLLETQRANIQKEIDELKAELKSLEKERKKREYSRPWN